MAREVRSKDGELLRVRGYQQEMFQRSLKGNSIVVMDTGSGKTFVALLRIEMELDQCPSNKYVWFLAPTVALCNQQHRYLESYLPAVKMRLLVGSDNVDRWSTQDIWNDALRSNRVIVSTHAVLSDALTHGFVKMRQLHLLVFDEAHHCTRNHPANKIMNRYHEAKERGETSLPHILGLTASPTFRSKGTDVNKIEKNLDSIAITPRVNRHELLLHVHRPTFETIIYFPCIIDDDTVLTPAIEYLKQFARQAQVTQSQPGNYSSRKSLCDYTRDQLKTFHRKAVHIYGELGSWASDYFIGESVALLHKSTSDDNWGTGIKTELQRLLNHPKVHSARISAKNLSDIALSAKVEHLISFLDRQNPAECSGLIFVQQRAAVGVLHHLLSLHPRTKDRFQCATFVGMSTSSNRKYSLSELFDMKTQAKALTEFRARKKNLVIATSVLEEGIDVSACNLVICFDPPSNLKSFIQRRGRARHEKSQFVTFFPLDHGGASVGSLLKAEEKLIEHYMKEPEDREAIEEVLENEQEEEQMDYNLEVESTGAKITGDDAISHIHHFCSTLSPIPYVSLLPEFAYEEVEEAPGKPKRFFATVTLPGSVVQSVRERRSLKSWESERKAAKDASFQSYLALFEAGLLNDNLLPKIQDWTPPDLPEMAKGLIGIKLQAGPWADMARDLHDPAATEPVLYEMDMFIKTLDEESCDPIHLVLSTPLRLDDIPPVIIEGSNNVTFHITFENRQTVVPRTSNRIQLLTEVTGLLYGSLRKIKKKGPFLAFFSPRLGEQELESWLKAHNGHQSALKVYRKSISPSPDSSAAIPQGLVRSHLRWFAPHKFAQWALSSDPDSGKEVVEVECVSLSLRRMFTDEDPMLVDDKLPKHIYRFPLRECSIDNLPVKFLEFNFLAPEIFAHIELSIISRRLCNTLLKQVQYQDLSHVTTALVHANAGWKANYERYEFIGDAILKYVVSAQLFAENPFWTEGYLSKARDYMICNQTLCNSALDLGLDAFFVTDLPQRGAKWQPNIVSDYIGQPEKRLLKAKRVADVVEALIGAAYIEDGLLAAKRCINVFLPDIKPVQLKFSLPPGELSLGETVKVENVLGYQFKNKALLREAFSHAASRFESYDRLEFLGDAILDFLVVDFLTFRFKHLSEGQMTQFKAALVNFKLLGFLNLSLTHEEELISVDAFQRRVIVTKQLSIWQFLSHQNQDIASSQRRCLARFKRLEGRIREKLESGNVFPRNELVELAPEKFYGDLIESVIAAIFIDDGGVDFKACREFVERLGLFKIAERLVTDDVRVAFSGGKVPAPLLGGAQLSFEYETGQMDETGVEDKDLRGVLSHRCMAKVDGVQTAWSPWCVRKEDATLLATDEVTVRLQERVNAQNMEVDHA